jgi:hypothetical protein
MGVNPPITQNCTPDDEYIWGICRKARESDRQWIDSEAAAAMPPQTPAFRGSSLARTAL